jgi:hypothetical protein
MKCLCKYEILEYLKSSKFYKGLESNEPFNNDLFEKNIICNKIVIFIYYWMCFYIIIRTIFILFVIMLCLIND